jgi:hypothetical protein
MARGDITLYQAATQGATASQKHQVVAGGTPPAILAGEPVGKTLGNAYVVTLANSKPVVGTDYIAGVAVSDSTELSATTDGLVDVIPVQPGQIWLIAPKVAATWNTQAKYNALVGARVTLDKTSGTYTINSTDGSTNGCVIEYLDISKYPGLVAFSFRAGAMYFA